MVIKITDYPVPPYGICMGLAFIVSFLIAYYLLRKVGIPSEIIRLSILMNVVFVLIGGKIYTVLVATDDNVRLWNASFSSVGGLIGMLVGIELFNKIYDQNKTAFRSIYILVIPLLYGISKIGCLLAGCCCGIPYSGIGSVKYIISIKNTQNSAWNVVSTHIPSENVFPVQLIEAFIFALIFIFGYFLYKRQMAMRATTFVLLAGCVCKFSLEYLRWDNIDRMINANQMICLLLFIITIVFIKYRGRVNG